MRSYEFAVFLGILGMIIGGISVAMANTDQNWFPGVDAAHEANIRVAMCGEMAGDPMYCLILLGMELDELSMSHLAIPRIKRIIRGSSLKEAKILLKHSAWTVSDIAYALGFTEVTHFNNFFKKHVQLSPLKFRNF